jgi:catechol 2,3-dioxygenase
MSSFHLPPQTRLLEIHIRTQNLDDALRFYQDVLGMKVIERTEIGAALSATGQSPAIIRISVDRNTSGLISARLAVPCGEVLFALEQRAAVFGYKTARDPASPNLLQLRDPHGLLLEVEAIETCGEFDGKTASSEVRKSQRITARRLGLTPKK